MKKEAIIRLAAVGLATSLVPLGVAAPAQSVPAGVNGRIAYAGFNATSIFVVDPINGSFVYDVDGVSPDPNVQNLSPAWSPDGARVAYLSNKSSNFEIYVVNADGTGRKRVTRDGGNKAELTWSPDGSRFAYRGFFGETIKLVGADGGAVTTINTYPYEPSGLDWSPDGDELVFSGHDSFSEHGERTIEVVEVESGTLRHITEPTGTASPANETSPSWSPDGTQLLYEYRDGQVYRAPSDGSGSQSLVLSSAVLSSNPDAHPSWSPDGQRVLFNGSGGSLQSATTTGTDVRTLFDTNVDIDQRAAWGRPMKCQGKNATFYGTPASGPVTGTSGDDVLVGWSGTDVLSGGAGNDTICSGGGKDTVTGNEGDDSLYGQGGADTLKGSAGNDLLAGGLSADAFYGGEGNDTLQAKDGVADSHLAGGAGTDIATRDSFDPAPTSVP